MSYQNIIEATNRVKSNKGAPGVDKMSVDEIEGYINKHYEEIKEQVLTKQYKPHRVKKSIYTKTKWKEKTTRNTNCSR